MLADLPLTPPSPNTLLCTMLAHDRTCHPRACSDHVEHVLPFDTSPPLNPIPPPLQVCGPSMPPSPAEAATATGLQNGVAQEATTAGRRQALALALGCSCCYRSR